MPPGRKAHAPTDEQRRTVKAMSAYGIPQTEISKVIGIDEKTLRKFYREELDTAEAEANAKVAESLYKKATGDGNQAVTAAIFWLKTRARWKEPVDVNFDTPLTIKVTKYADDPSA